MLASPLTSVALATSLTSHWRRSDSLERMGRKTTGIGPRGLLVVSNAPAAPVVQRHVLHGGAGARWLQRRPHELVDSDRGVACLHDNTSH